MKITLEQLQDLRTQVNALVAETHELGNEHPAYQLAFALSHLVSDIELGQNNEQA